MAAESDLTSLRLRKMVRRPNLRPKTKLGQKTVRNTNRQERIYTDLREAFYKDPYRIDPLVQHMSDQMVHNNGLVEAEEGVYTWILKRGHLHASRLRSNQEIGTLHVDLNMMTLEERDIGEEKGVSPATLANRREEDAMPMAAGELLLVRRGGETHLYFNLQSGTYSEKLLTCRATKRAEEQGIRIVKGAKGTKGARGAEAQKAKAMVDALKVGCREEMVEDVQDGMERATGLPKERIHFLSCEEEIQRVLESVPFLTGRYDHGSCRDDDDYMESIAGRNLIRRYRVETPAENMAQWNTYFSWRSEEPSAPSASISLVSLGKRKEHVTTNQPATRKRGGTRGAARARAKGAAGKSGKRREYIF